METKTEIDDVRVLVTSASGNNGEGYGALLSFNSEGELLGRFSSDPRIADPRGMAPDASGSLIYVNSGDERVLALDRRGEVVRDSRRIPGLDPGGGKFGPDGRYYVTARRRGSVYAMRAALEEHGELVVPENSVAFPRGFDFGRGGQLYLASGVGPSGQGDNTILVFEGEDPQRAAVLISDAELSPLDLTISPEGTLLVSSEWPFGTPDAVVSVREYDALTGQLVRILAPDPSLGFRRPRGLRLIPEGRLYWVGEEHVVAFDYPSGEFQGASIRLERLNGQAVAIVP
jgi:DNA-binding beta-propeller fold protein YncE